MQITESTRFDSTKRDAKNYDVTILVSYAALAIVFLLTIYFASKSPGTEPSEFLSMTVFP